MMKIRNLVWALTVSVLFAGSFTDTQAEWRSSGTGYYYTMDTLTNKPLTDITNHTSAVVWEPDSGYYVVDDSLMIWHFPIPDTLIIGPGTVIEMEPGRAIQFHVRGILKTRGNASDRVVFRSHAVAPQSDDWNDLRFSEPSGTAVCTLKYCIVENAHYGVGTNACSPVILNNILRNNYWYGVITEWGNPTISGNLITEVRKGVHCGDTTSPYIGGNEIRNVSLVGINVEGTAAPYIVGNLISDAFFAGIDCYHRSFPTIVGNTITDCEWGIVVHDSANPVVGGRLEDANDIYGNQSSVGSNLHNHTENLISAEYNYWGLLNVDSILSTLYGSVDFIPFTDSAHSEVYSPLIPPVADANGPYSGSEGTPIIFDGSNSTDDGTIVLYEWDFNGDGVYDSTGVSVAYTWYDDHSGVITLRVTDNEGLTDMDSTTVTVSTHTWEFLDRVSMSECHTVQCYPNPFSSSAVLRYQLSEAREVTLRLYDISGKLVRTLAEKQFQQGQCEVVWNGCDDYGVIVGKGVYFYRLNANERVVAGKIVFMR